MTSAPRVEYASDGFLSFGASAAVRKTKAALRQVVSPEGCTTKPIAK
jgi:hypothetical protein